MELSTLQFDELKALREQINERLRDLEREAVKTLEQQAIKFGFQLIKNGLGLRSKVPAAKYRDAAGNEWSGKGRKPKWINDASDAGTDIETFRVA